MTLPKTIEDLNCPCNGIYKCGLHSPVNLPKYDKTPSQRFQEIQNYGKVEKEEI